MTRDLRKYTKQTNFRVVVGIVLFLLIVGNGLIYWIYGPGAGVLGVLCMGALGVPLMLIVGYLRLLDWIKNKADES